ncbi:MAG: sugar-binding protein [Oscillospiraceae bacterium]|nr:sugar-binding protein [Oscillospiraceae bacterium]
MKRWIASALLAVLLAGCAAPEAQPQNPETTLPMAGQQEERPQVGVCMPTDQDPYWEESARLLQERLTELGCSVRLHFAGNDAREQDRQLQELLEDNVDCLVIGAVDSVELVQSLQQARTKGIPVVAYDRLLMDTEAVSSYVTFDYEAMGAAMGQQVAQQYALETAQEEKRSYTVEFLMGSPDDNNAVLLHKGLLAVLQPWLDLGVLQCPSGRVEFSDTYILRWEADNAQEQMEQLLQKYYDKDVWPDLCIAASDALAEGCLQALWDAGCTEDKLPAVTGQGGSKEALQRIADGQQAFSVFTDLRVLTENCVELVKSHLEGTGPKTRNSMDNHVMTVPSVFCNATLIHGENYRKVMLDSGMYTEDTLPQ